MLQSILPWHSACPTSDVGSHVDFARYAATARNPADDNRDLTPKTSRRIWSFNKIGKRPNHARSKVGELRICHRSHWYLRLARQLLLGNFFLIQPMELLPHLIDRQTVAPLAQ